MMSHGWQVVFLGISCLAMTACGNKKEGPTRWKAFPVAIYADPALVPNDQAKSDFSEAMAFWESKVGKQLFDYRGTWNGQGFDNGDSVSQNSMYYSSPWSYAQNIAAQTVVLSRESEIEGAVIMVNPGTSFCAGDCTGQSSRTSQKKVFAHELGHFLGMGHNTDTANIMYPDALPGGTLGGLTVNTGELQPLLSGHED